MPGHMYGAMHYECMQLCGWDTSSWQNLQDTTDHKACNCADVLLGEVTVLCAIQSSQLHGLSHTLALRKGRVLV